MGNGARDVGMHVIEIQIKLVLRHQSQSILDYLFQRLRKQQRSWAHVASGTMRQISLSMSFYFLHCLPIMTVWVNTVIYIVYDVYTLHLAL